VSEGEALLEELRPGAFAVAYRMLGSVAEAEDVVQEAPYQDRPLAPLAGAPARACSSLSSPRSRSTWDRTPLPITRR
jgi:Sigma-70 region 2